MDSEASLGSIEILYENNYNLKANKMATIDLPVNNILKYLQEVENDAIEILYEDVKSPRKSSIYPSYLNSINIYQQYSTIVDPSIVKNGISLKMTKNNQLVNYKTDNASNSDILIYKLPKNYQEKRKKVPENEIKVLRANVKSTTKSLQDFSSVNNVNNNPRSSTKVYLPVQKNGLASKRPKSKQAVDCEYNNTENTTLPADNLQQIFQGKCKVVPEDANILCENVKSLRKTPKKSPKVNNRAKFRMPTSKNNLAPKKQKNNHTVNTEVKSIANPVLPSSNLIQNYQSKDKGDDVKIIYENATSTTKSPSNNLKNCHATSGNVIINQNSPSKSDQQKFRSGLVSSSNLPQNYQVKDKSVPEGDFNIVYENISPTKSPRNYLKNCDPTSCNVIVNPKSPSKFNQQKLKNGQATPSNFLQNYQVNDNSAQDMEILYEAVTSPTKLSKNLKNCSTTTCSVIVNQKSLAKPNQQKPQNSLVSGKLKREPKASRKAILEINEWIKSEIKIEGCQTNYECTPDNEDESVFGVEPKKKFSCLFCTRKFVYFTYFKNHMFRVHPETNEILNS